MKSLTALALAAGLFSAGAAIAQPAPASQPGNASEAAR